jgi:hypothetical protein
MEQGTDPKTGLPSQIPMPKQVFNIKRIAEEVAKEMFEITDPDDYIIQEEVEQKMEEMSVPPASVAPTGMLPGESPNV